MLFGFPLEDYSATHTGSNTENKTQNSPPKPYECRTGTALQFLQINIDLGQLGNLSPNMRVQQKFLANKFLDKSPIMNN